MAHREDDESGPIVLSLGSLSTRVFETRMATGSGRQPEEDISRATTAFPDFYTTYL